MIMYNSVSSRVADHLFNINFHRDPQIQVLFLGGVFYRLSPHLYCNNQFDKHDGSNEVES